MSPLAQAVLRNAQERHVRALRSGRRKAAQAKAIEEEPEGHRHKADPWNTTLKFDEMRLYMCESARATLKELKNR